MKIAVPDLISNSYFPAVAAVELGKFAEQGIDASIELVFPVNKAYADLRDARVDCVAGSAHSALAAFSRWEGVKLLCAQAQGMYWFWSCGRTSIALAAISMSSKDARSERHRGSISG